MDSPVLREAVGRFRAYLPPGALGARDPDEAMERLVPLAAELAHPPVSNYHVGAVGKGVSGALYLGFNVEFPGQALGQTIHAEQFVVALALAHRESRLERLALSTAPCGHCRQFLAELPAGARLKLAIAGKPETTLEELLPLRFGPEDLGLSCALMSHPTQALPWDGEDPLVRSALAAAERSYAPYSGCLAGLALDIRGEFFSGSYAENAAFNPSLPPLQAALVTYYARYPDPPAIRRAVLVESGPRLASQAHQAEGLLRTLAPGIVLDVREM